MLSALGGVHQRSAREVLPQEGWWLSAATTARPAVWWRDDRPADRPGGVADAAATLPPSPPNCRRTCSTVRMANSVLKNASSALVSSTIRASEAFYVGRRGPTLLLQRAANPTPSTIRSSVHPQPSSDSSACNGIRARVSFRAAAFPAGTGWFSASHVCAPPPAAPRVLAGRAKSVRSAFPSRSRLVVCPPGGSTATASAGVAGRRTSSRRCAHGFRTVARRRAW